MTTFKNIGLEINIPDLHYIINVDFPPNLQTYMDRLRKGVVHYTLFSREDGKHAERLIYSLKQARQDYDSNLSTMSKAWLECGRDMRFMPMSKKIYDRKIFIKLNFNYLKTLSPRASERPVKTIARNDTK